MEVAGPVERVELALGARARYRAMNRRARPAPTRRMIAPSGPGASSGGLASSIVVNGNVVGGFGADRGGPVDDGDLAVVTHEQVEGMQVTVADHRGALNGAPVGERAQLAREVRPAKYFRAGFEVGEEVLHPPRNGRCHRVDRGRDRCGIERMEHRHRAGELRREAREQLGVRRRAARPLRSPSGGLPDSEVHQRPAPPSSSSIGRASRTWGVG